MRRALWVVTLMAAGVLSAGGCANEGGVELSWEFAALPDGSGGPEPSSLGCGRHGVDSVLVTGANDAGDGANIVALCTDGGVKRTLPVGTWSFSFHTLDIRGRLIRALEEPEAMAGAIAVTEGATTIVPIATLSPRAACSDGVDNDDDGRVDLTDLDCGSADGLHESTASQP